MRSWWWKQEPKMMVWPRSKMRRQTKTRSLREKMKMIRHGTMMTRQEPQKRWKQTTRQERNSIPVQHSRSMMIQRGSRRM